jgi:hypothetical protein
MARLLRIVLTAAAYSVLLVVVACESTKPDATTYDSDLSRRLTSVSARIERLDERLNETWSRVRHLRTTKDASEFLLPGENGTPSTNAFELNGFCNLCMRSIRLIVLVLDVWAP